MNHCCMYGPNINYYIFLLTYSFTAVKNIFCDGTAYVQLIILFVANWQIPVPTISPPAMMSKTDNNITLALAGAVMG